MLKNVFIALGECVTYKQLCTFRVPAKYIDISPGEAVKYTKLQLYEWTPYMRCTILIGWGVKIAMMPTQWTSYMRCSILIGWGVKIALKTTQHKNKESLAGSIEIVQAVILWQRITFTLMMSTFPASTSAVHCQCQATNGCAWSYPLCDIGS